MKQVQLGMVLVLVVLCCSLFGQAQQTGAASTNSVVPTRVSFSGVLTGSNGKPLTGITGVTFSLYAGQEGGAPLWLETQNVEPDKNGNYTAQLGSTTSQGLPSSLFVSGQARWLGVRPQGQAEQSRVMHPMPQRPMRRPASPKPASLPPPPVRAAVRPAQVERK